MRFYFIETWGCQMNRHDSEHLEGELRRSGLQPADSADSADLVLLNTCSVRDKPVQKLLSRIGELANRRRPPVVGVCGCVAEQEGRELIARSRAVGFVLGPGQVERLSEALLMVDGGARPVLTGFETDRDFESRPVVRKSATRGMVTVMEGCNEFCTFCIVPYTRGRELSRPMDEVLREVHGLAAQGLKEVELLGQTINAYRCPTTDADFADLLEAVASLEGLLRVRYITSHPRHFNDRLIGVLARHSKVSRYLHLPVQSGSNAVLKKMHRRYTREDYLELVARIRKSVPDINLSTDIIVGFPGESEQDFMESLELLKQIRFGQVYAFAYSPRPKTPAALYQGQVEDRQAKSRLHRLFEISDRISLELNQALVGSVVPVLIDGASRRDDTAWQGRGEDNRVVNLPKSPGDRVGDVVDARIVRASPHSLVGEPTVAVGRLPVVQVGATP